MSDPFTDPQATRFTPPFIQDGSSEESFAPVPPSVKPIEVSEAEVVLYRDRESLEKALKPLGRQACVVFALRAARRVSVLVELNTAFTEAIAAGFVCKPIRWYGRAAYAAYAAIDAHAHAAAAAAETAHTYAADTATAAADGDDAWRATSLDLCRLKKLKLISNAPPLTGWDDLRLSPLWPDGVPEWHKSAEQNLLALKQLLTNRPDPTADLRRGPHA